MPPVRESAESNQYLLHDHKVSGLNGLFDPSDPECLDEAVLPYFGRVLHQVNELIGDAGLTFVVTTFNVRDLPEYGPRVVACILEDELSREPRYRDQVGAVFRCYPNLPCHLNGVRGWNMMHWLGGGFVVARDFCRDGSGRARSLLKTMSGRKLAPVFEMPIGCNAYAKTDFIPLEEREFDLYFKGSVNHEADQGRMSSMLRPKVLERMQMKQALDRLAEREPWIKVNGQYTASFEESIATSRCRYLEGMMNCKFSLTPRGGAPHTFRFFEALRYGSIPIGVTFPDSFEGAPFIRLEKWNDLPVVVPTLLSYREQLYEMHRQALDWWENQASEKITASRIVEKLCLAGLVEGIHLTGSENVEEVIEPEATSVSVAG